MKKLTVKKGIDCQACLSCSIACSKAWFKTEDPDKAFVQIRMKGAASGQRSAQFPGRRNQSNQIQCFRCLGSIRKLGKSP